MLREMLERELKKTSELHPILYVILSGTVTYSPVLCVRMKCHYPLQSKSARLRGSTGNNRVRNFACNPRAAQVQHISPGNSSRSRGADWTGR